VADVQRQIRDGNTDAARQVVHRLRGTAGNLCLDALRHELGVLENGLKTDHPVPNAIALTQAQEIANTLIEIGQALAEANDMDPKPLPAASTTLDPVQCRGLAEVALASAARNRFDNGAMEALIALLHASGENLRAEKLEEASLSFEFNTAQQLLQALLAWLDNPTGELAR
jgi:two-component system sensor histidine kinase/response regulator